MTITFTKVDREILEIMKNCKTENDRIMITTYLFILSKFREFGVEIANKEYIEAGLMSKNKVKQILDSLEKQGWIIREGKTITKVKHSPEGLETRYIQVPNGLLLDSTLKPTMKLLYVKLASIVPDRFGYVKIKQESLATSLGLSPKSRGTISAYMDTLLKRGWITDIDEGSGFNPCRRYRPFRIDKDENIELQRQRKAEQQKEKYQLLAIKIGTGQRLSKRELFDWFKCLVENKGEIYNEKNSQKDIGVLKNLLTKVDSNTLAQLIEKYVEMFNRRFKNHIRKTIKLQYLGSDDVFNQVINAYDFELVQSQAQEEEVFEIVTF